MYVGWWCIQYPSSVIKLLKLITRLCISKVTSYGKIMVTTAYSTESCK